FAESCWATAAVAQARAAIRATAMRSNGPALLRTDLRLFPQRSILPPAKSAPIIPNHVVNDSCVMPCLEPGIQTPSVVAWIAGSTLGGRLPPGLRGARTGEYQWVGIFGPWYNWGSEKSHPLGRWKFLWRTAGGIGNPAVPLLFAEWYCLRQLR